MEILRAGIADIPEIQLVANGTWPDTFRGILRPEQIAYMLKMMYGTNVLEKAISDANQAFWLFRHEGKTLGFAATQHQYKGAPDTKLHKIYVLPAAQGLGAGKKLIAHVTGEARKAGSKRVLLNVNRYNKATGFYEYLGFRIIGEEDIDIGNGYLMEDFIMELLL